MTGLRDLPAADRPRVLVSQSGAGFYGERGDEPLDESAPAGDDFVARMVVEWEAEASAAAELGLRVALTRTGPVLSEGGALGKMLPFFKMGLGGPVAGGRQYFPWVHLDDVIGAMLFCLDTDTASGPLNVTAPEPVTNREFSRALGRVLHRPAFAPVPGAGGEDALRGDGDDRHHGPARDPGAPDRAGLLVPPPGVGGRAARGDGRGLAPGARR